MEQAKPKASDIQYGGLHYKTEYNHWDWSADVGMGWGYFTAACTKYLSRYGKKGGEGIVGLNKAKHYIEKLVELVHEKRVTLPTRFSEERMAEITRATDRFCDVNELSSMQRMVCHLLKRPRRTAELEAAIDCLEDIIQAESVKEQMKQAEGVGVLTRRDFAEEGGTATADLWQCKRCREHIYAPIGVDPSTVHPACKLKDVAPTVATLDADDETEDDGSEPGRGYVRQD